MKSKILRPSEKDSRGFSLIETCFVIIIVGLLLAGAAHAYMLYQKTQKFALNQTRIQNAQAALAQYWADHGALPCPAPSNLTPANAGFETAFNTTGCPDPVTTPPPAGIVAVNGTAPPADLTAVIPAASAKVTWIGLLPARTLMLGDQAGQDADGNILSYAVSGFLTSNAIVKNVRATVNTANSPATYNPLNVGTITVKNGASPSTVITPSAPFVIVSHGADGAGAISANGVAQKACNAAALDGENCNNDATFRATGAYSMLDMPSNPNHFDDMAAYGFVPDVSANIQYCNKEGLIYSPGAANADAHGCISSSASVPALGACSDPKQVPNGYSSNGTPNCMYVKVKCHLGLNPIYMSFWPSMPASSKEAARSGPFPSGSGATSYACAAGEFLVNSHWGGGDQGYVMPDTNGDLWEWENFNSEIFDCCTVQLSATP